MICFFPFYLITLCAEALGRWAIVSLGIGSKWLRRIPSRFHSFMSWTLTRMLPSEQMACKCNYVNCIRVLITFDRPTFRCVCVCELNVDKRSFNSICILFTFNCSWSLNDPKMFICILHDVTRYLTHLRRVLRSSAYVMDQLSEIRTLFRVSTGVTAQMETKLNCNWCACGSPVHIPFRQIDIVGRLRSVDTQKLPFAAQIGWH